MLAPKWVAYAKAMVSEGNSFEAVGDELGVSGVAVAYWCVPGRREEVLSRCRERNTRAAVQQRKREYNTQYRLRPGEIQRKQRYNKEYTSQLSTRVKLALRRSERKAAKEGYASCNSAPTEIESAYNGKCAICGYDERTDTGLKPKLHLDHCHATGAFRGWLCLRCNNALGFVGDSPERCDALKNYLKRNGK